MTMRNFEVFIKHCHDSSYYSKPPAKSPISQFRFYYKDATQPGNLTLSNKLHLQTIESLNSKHPNISLYTGSAETLNVHVKAT